MATVDFTGARGSNTGDVFHELWALRQAISLLSPDAQLQSMTVEGVRAADVRGSVEQAWEGVDVALYYGSDATAEPERAEFCQLKYSAADATKSWTVARLSAGRKGNVANSPIRRLADAYGSWISKKGRTSSMLTVKLVTNQPIARALLSALEFAREGDPALWASAQDARTKDVNRLVAASGLPPTQFRQFARRLDLEGQTGSRFAIEDRVLTAIADWAETDLIETEFRLRDFIRTRMLPEASREIISRETMLLQFGVSSPESLFPCPSKIAAERAPVRRNVVGDVLNRMLAGSQRLCLHGSGGVGKTTCLQEIALGLPAGSVLGLLDCYGGGSYLDSNAYRHQDREAFLQLTNSIAAELRLPLVLVQSDHTDHARQFHRRLRLAAAALAVAYPDALLVVVADAADNSIAAAERHIPPQTSFVHNLARLGDLSTNVRILVSSRTSRLGSLKLPAEFELFPVEGFTRSETAQNVARFWPASEDWIDDFHSLSQANPRVQGYALKGGFGNPNRALELLRPAGKGLDQVFRGQFAEAIKKSGQQEEALATICAGLVTLPRPIPISDLASVTRFTEVQLNEICGDLAPGIRIDRNLIGFADEDFEHFVGEVGAAEQASVQASAASWLLQRSPEDAYASLNVASALFAAGRGRDLLELVEREPSPPAQIVVDPIRRSEAHVQRLQLAIRVCRNAGNSAAALKFVLIGAEAIRRDGIMRDLLSENPELTARFARDTASRLILGDPGRIKQQGPLLLQMTAEDARMRDFIAVREGRRRFRAWFQHREDERRRSVASMGQEVESWSIEAGDYAAWIYSTLLTDGPRAALGALTGTRPNTFTMETAIDLAPRLVAEGKVIELNEVRQVADDAWAVFALVPLAMSGAEIDYSLLAKSINSLTRHGLVDIREIAEQPSYQHGPLHAFLDLILTGCELCVANEIRPECIRPVLNCFCDPEIRRIDRRYMFQSALLDLLIRANFLSQTLNGVDPSGADLFTPRPARSEPRPDEPALRRAWDHEAKRQSDHDGELMEFLSPIVPAYAARAKVIASHLPPAEFEKTLTDGFLKLKSESWRFDRHHESHAFRSRLAFSLSALLGAGYDPSTVFAQAVAAKGGVAGEVLSGDLELFLRFASRPLLHDALLRTLSDQARMFRKERIGGAQKARSLARTAGMLAIISPADASEVFRAAIEVASELDTEIFDQLRLIDSLVERGAPDIASNADDLARELTDVVLDAAIRLEDQEGFPWSNAMNSLSCLGWPAALACVSRWDDSSIISLDSTLPPVVEAGLRRKLLTAEQAATLLQFLEHVPGDLVDRLRERSGGGDSWAPIAEELARDALLDRARLDVPALLREPPKTPARPSWLRRLAEQAEFAAALAVDLESSEKEGADRHSVARDHQWDPKTLVNADELSTIVHDVRRRSREVNNWIGIAEILKFARPAVPATKRVDHLEAILAIRDEAFAYDAIPAMLDAVEDWASTDTPAMEAWRRKRIPDLLAARLPEFVRYLPWEDRHLATALQYAGPHSAEIQDALLSGLETWVDQLAAPCVFALAGFVGRMLHPRDAAELVGWYVARLSAPLAQDVRDSLAPTDRPSSPTEAVGRFLFASMSDIDQRRRWRAAHATRRAARLGDKALIVALASEYERSADPAFRKKGAPFYWIAARQWMLIALDRIAEESPTVASAAGARLLSVALDDSFPHVLIRAFAKDAVLKLIAAGLIAVDQQIREAIGRVNNGSVMPASKSRERYRDIRQVGGKRFRFDPMDTLPYWYSPALRAFADVTDEELIEGAERWIIDQWDASSDDDWRSEPRRRRTPDSSYTLYSNRHGSSPILERYHTYLEWNALWCTVGELIKTRPLVVVDDDQYDEFSYLIAREKLTEPPLWLADIIVPRPLTKHLWQEPEGDVAKWANGATDEDLASHIFPPNAPDYVVVHSDVATRSDHFSESIHISSALVAPATALALVRALQTMESADYYLPPEGHDCEIELAPYLLKGWLVHDGGDRGIDSSDLFRNGKSRIEATPGATVSKWAGLAQRYGPNVCWAAEASKPMFEYFGWGRQETYDDHEEYLGKRVVSEGSRLVATKRDLLRFLAFVQMDLIVEVKIDRKNRGRESSYDSEEQTIDASYARLFLLRSNGGCELAERRLGSWTSDSA